MWTIYSIGDSYFLSSILNAVAMIFNSHIPDALAAIGLVLGLLYQSYRGVVNAQGISMMQLFAVFILYLLLFVPKADVIVHDVYTQNIRKVDNIPLGTAAAGSIISNIGFRITEVFKDAFAIPEAQDRGFASSLVILAKMREDLSNILKLGRINNVNTADFKESWGNYIKECTLIGVDLGILKIEDIYNGGNILEALRFNSEIYGTAISTQGSFSNQTCSKAYQDLVAYTRGEFAGSLTQVLSKDADISSYLKNDSLYGADINGALETLGLSSISAQDYMLATILLPIFEESSKDKYTQEHAVNAAVMLDDAINARNVQWSTEQSMFFSIIRPVLTFFEGLVFALTPIMAFVAVLGAAGTVMLGKYLMILIWIELWQPLLAIINLYLVVATKGNIALTNFEEGSFLGIIATQKIIAQYLGIGGMLSAGVPALSLMILYAGVVSASGFTSRMSGQDHIKEGVMSPGIMTEGSVVSRESAFNISNLGGIHKEGGAGFIPELSLNSSFNKALSAAKGNVLSKESAFSKSLANIQSETLANNLSNTTLEQIGSRIGSSSSLSSSLVNSQTKDIASRLGLASSEQNALRGAVNSVLSGANVPLSQLASLALSNSSTRSQSMNVSKLNGELENLSKNSGLMSQYQRLLSADISNGVASSISSSLSEGQTQSLAHSAREAESAREELSFVENASSKLASTQNINGLTITNALASNEKLMDSLSNYGLIREDISQRAQELMPLMRSILPNSKQAYAAGMLTAMQEKDPQSALKYMLSAAGLGNSDIGSFSGKFSEGVNSSHNHNIGFGGFKDKDMVFASGGEDLRTPQSSLDGSLSNGDLLFGNFNDNRSVINDAYNSTYHKAKSYEEVLKEPLGSETMFGGNGERVSKSYDDAYNLGISSGLTGAQSRVYASLSEGNEASKEDLERVYQESGDKEVFNGIIERLNYSARHNDSSALAPVANFNKAKE